MSCFWEERGCEEKKREEKRRDRERERERERERKVPLGVGYYPQIYVWRWVGREEGWGKQASGRRGGENRLLFWGLFLFPPFECVCI